MRRPLVLNSEMKNPRSTSLLHCVDSSPARNMARSLPGIMYTANGSRFLMHRDAALEIEVDNNIFIVRMVERSARRAVHR